MKTYETVEEYAEHIRRVTSPLLGRLCERLGPDHAVTLAVLELCSEADDLVEGHAMALEATHSDAYDLRALTIAPNPVPGE